MNANTHATYAKKSYRTKIKQNIVETVFKKNFHATCVIKMGSNVQSLKSTG